MDFGERLSVGIWATSDPRRLAHNRLSRGDTGVIDTTGLSLLGSSRVAFYSSSLEASGYTLDLALRFGDHL